VNGYSEENMHRAGWLIVCGSAVLLAAPALGGGTLVGVLACRSSCGGTVPWCAAQPHHRGKPCPPYPAFFGGWYYGIGVPAVPVWYPPEPGGTAAPTNQPPLGDQPPTAFAPPPDDLQETAWIDIRLPTDAELWVQGVKMDLAGPVRRIVSPRLQPDRSYVYTIRAVWRRNDQDFEHTARVLVRAGDRQGLLILGGTAVPAGPAQSRAAAR
jgi:uncharacterized protein (TIGR03000 family)